MPEIRNSDLALDGPIIPLPPLRHGHITYFSILKSENYPHRSTRLLPACFVLTHMYHRKIFKRSPNIELLQVRLTIKFL